MDTQNLVNLDLDVGEELPVLDRNFTKFLLLVPGAQALHWPQNAAKEIEAFEKGTTFC